MGNIIRGKEGKRETGIHREKRDNWELEVKEKEQLNKSWAPAPLAIVAVNPLY